MEPIDLQELNCEQAIGFLAAYLEGSLPPNVKALFDAHLAECPECCDYLASYQMTLQLARQAPLASQPPLPESLVNAILAAKQSDDESSPG